MAPCGVTGDDAGEMRARVRRSYFFRAFAILLVFAAGAAAEKAPIVSGAEAVAVFTPRPEYPYEARLRRVTGSGIARMEVDIATGKVTRAYMQESTGSTILDKEALRAFQKWRFVPGTVVGARVPITFTMKGDVMTTVQVRAKPMDDVLARFLGKGTVRNAPMPQYPRSKPWTVKSGEGVYELRVDATGSAVGVKVLKSSGDATFDEATRAALRNWRLTRGPLVIELPLSFTLSPASYSVAIPRRR